MVEYIQNMQFKGLVSNNCLIQVKRVEPEKRKTSVDGVECCFVNENLYWNEDTETSWCKVCGEDTGIPF